MISMELRGGDRLKARLAVFQSRLPEASGAALTGAATDAQSAIARRLESDSRLGRGVYRSGEFDPERDVEVIKPESKDGGASTGLRLRGFARLMEKGGRIRPHAQGRGMHPGAQVKRYGYGEEALRKEAQRAGTGVMAAIQRLARSIFG